MSGMRRRFAEILDAHGWPGKRLVGCDGAEAAWTLALHTMPDPKLLRRCLRLMLEAVAKGDAEPQHVAHLVDRVSLVERNVQIFMRLYHRFLALASGSARAALSRSSQGSSARNLSRWSARHRSIGGRGAQTPAKPPYASAITTLVR
jgi:hypothetical protein